MYYIEEIYFLYSQIFIYTSVLFCRSLIKCVKCNLSIYGVLPGNWDPSIFLIENPENLRVVSAKYRTFIEPT